MDEVLAFLEPLKDKYRFDRIMPNRDKHRVCSLLLVSNESQQFELDKLLDEFTTRIQNLGVTIQSIDYKEE